MNLEKKLLIISLSTFMVVIPCLAQAQVVTAYHPIEVLQENKIEVASAKSSKIQYLTWLNSIQASMVDLESYYDGSGKNTAYAESIRFTRWDDALNEIYGVLKKELSPSTMESLRQAQRNWITYRDAEADKAVAEGGWGEYSSSRWKDVAYISTRAQLTEERCYYLVNNYMS